MARVLAISSQVVRGHVGNSAAAFALQRLGHDVWMLPTVILSNHPGHAHVAGTRIAPEALGQMIKALAGNGWLGEIDAVLTGYLPTAEHVEFAVAAIAAVKAARRKALVVVDPVLGDDPGGLYVDEAAAIAVRARLLPLADCLTPNRFELEWLSGMPVTGQHSAQAAAAVLGPQQVLATSIPGAVAGKLLNVLWRANVSVTAEVAALKRVPHGTGDLLAALYLAQVLHGQAPEAALRLAVDGVAAVIKASISRDELNLTGTQDLWAHRRTGKAT